MGSLTIKRAVAIAGALCIALTCIGIRQLRISTDRNALTAGATGLISDEEMLQHVPSRASESDSEAAKWAAKLQRNRGDASAWVSLGDAFMQKIAETSDLSYYGRAQGAYRKALAIDPRKSEAMAGMARVCNGRREFEQAIDWAEKALAVDPKNSGAAGLLGDAEGEMGDYDAAFQQYQKMLDMRPGVDSYSRAAQALQLIGNTRKALWMMNKAVLAGGADAEKTAVCRANLAQILYSVGAYVPAAQVLSVGLKKKPDSVALLTEMARVKAAEKDSRAAIDYYRRSTDIAPQLEAVIALGDLYAADGRQREAEQQYALVDRIRESCRANGVRAGLLFARFYADHDRNLPEALQMAEEEYRTRKSVYAADTLAWCYYKNGRIAEAQTMIDTALRRNTPEALFLFHKGMICAKAGRRGPAQMALYACMSQNAHFHPLFEKVAIQTNMELGARPAQR